MKNHMRILCGGLLAACMLSACGKTVEIDPAKTMESLEEKITFTDKMAGLSMEKACQIYGVDEALVEDCAALRGSGATAENFSVWQAKDADSAQKLEEQLAAFVKSWTEGYADYKPEEVPKLESAILAAEGKYVILCVSADNEAAEAPIREALRS